MIITTRMKNQLRLFVYEYTCAALSGPDIPLSLRTEGRAMLAAVLADLEQIDGVETCTLLAENFPENLAQMCRRTGGEERAAFGELARAADYTLVIAPEFDELLETRCRWVAEAGGRSLNSSLAAIRLTADKWELAEQFRKRDVPTPPTISSANPLAGQRFPAVLKPRFGAGSQATFLIRDMDELTAFAASAEFTGEYILQPFLPGQPASVAFLLGPQRGVALWPAAQHLSSNGRFHYQGGTVPLPNHFWPRAIGLAEQAVRSVPGLRGYIGVDLVLGKAADGSEDVIIEINPRLTTSYIGLRQCAGLNLAKLLLELNTEPEGTEPLEILLPHPKRVVHFYPDGRWEMV